MNTLRKLIEDNELTVRAFAESVGVTENYVYQLLSGRRQLNHSLVFRIAARYGWKAAREIERAANLEPV